MGKKQHQSDKLYLTTTEWKTFYGGHKDDTATKLARAKFKRLPFTHCALSLLPFEDPIATQQGVIFDLSRIIPFLKRHGVNPVTGEKMKSSDLIPLNFAKNQDGEFHCPITYKIFTENSHIVFIRPTGNVFSHEAIEELNLKPRFFKDLVNDQPFTRKDIIEIQNPSDINKFNISNFHYVKLDLKLPEEEASTSKGPASNIRKMNNATKEVLATLEKEYKPEKKEEKAETEADEVSAAHYSTGRVAASLTSTAMPTVTSQKAATTDEDTLRYRRVTKKAYVRLDTTLGALNVELHADLTPLAAENFLVHCRKGYYDGTSFHRLVRNFMIQGGDPTGTGKGGVSIWGKPFKDEFLYSLSHAGRGVLSMANSGSDTNQSQFFITFHSAKHLDRKHTVFGRVVGGLDVLTALEHTPADGKTSKPEKDLRIVTATVFVDPFAEADEQLAKEREALRNKHKDQAKAEAAKRDRSKLTDGPAAMKAFRKGVGKYIAPAGQAQAQPSSSRDDDAPKDDFADPPPEPKKKKTKLVPAGSFGNFSKW